MAEVRTSVADKIKQFDKTSPTAGKVAELRAKLAKASSSNNVTTISPPARPAVVRSNSASTIVSNPNASTEITKNVIPRSSSSGVLSSIPLPSPPSNPSTPRNQTETEVEASPNISLISKVSETTPKPLASKVEESPSTPAALVSPSVTEQKEEKLSKNNSSKVLVVPADDTVKEVKPTKSNSSKVLSVTVEEATKPPEPTKTHSPTGMAASKLLLAADKFIPPTVEEQDYYVLWGLSFIVPFFLLRFVFELVRKFVLGPARMTVRFAPGGNKLLSFMYVKLGPVVVKLAQSAKEKLPPMVTVNSKAKAGLEKFLATLQTAVSAAYPHLLHLAESIKNLRFRQAAKETTAVLKAWAPMVLLLIPLTKNAIVAGRQGWLMFWRVSKTAVYLPFGSLLRKAVQKFGQSLSENPDVFAEQVAGLLGPIVGFFVAFVLLFGLGLSVGLVDYNMLSSMYLAWFFRLLGLVSEPSLLDQSAKLEDVMATGGLGATVVDPTTVASSGVVDPAAAAAAGATGGGGGFVW